MADASSSKLETLYKRVTDPEYKDGYRDGLQRKPKAYYTEAYLDGYRQGLTTAVIGTPDFNWDMLPVKR